MPPIQRFLTIALFLLAGLCADRCAFAQGESPTSLSTDDGWWEAGFPIKAGHARAVYDPVNDRILTHGGFAYIFTQDYLLERKFGVPQGWSEIRLQVSPGGRWYQTMIYDPVRRRAVLFGGFDQINVLQNDVWVLDLDGPPLWQQLVPLGVPPSPRRLHAAVYDPVRDRMLVLAGVGAATMDVWALSLAGTPEWTEIFPTGPSPVHHSAHSVIYDSLRDRLVMYGGDGPPSNQVWALDLAGVPQWQLLSTTGIPPDREEHRAIYDPLRDKMVVHGGRSIGPELHVLDLATLAWSVPDTTGGGEGPDNGHGTWAIYDPTRDDMVVRGRSSVRATDVFRLSLSTYKWSSETPLRQHRHSGLGVGVHDEAERRLIVYGGIPAFGIHPEYDGAEVHVLDLVTDRWSLMEVAGTPPPNRQDHVAVFDPVGERLVVYGGRPGSSGYLGDVWELSLSGPPLWTYLGDAPWGIRRAEAVYDPVRHRMLVFGGREVSGPTNNLYAFSLTTETWSQLAPGGSIPVLSDPALLYDPLRDRLIVHGGSGESSVYELPFTGPFAWNEIVPAGGPGPERDQHAAVYDAAQDRMIIFGGSPFDPWELSLSGTPEWRQLSTMWMPNHYQRDDPQLVLDVPNNRLVISGGSVFDPGNNETWFLHLGAAPVAVGEQPAQSLGAKLEPVAPNPFTTRTRMTYTLPRAAQVSLTVHDLQGRRVVTLVSGAQVAGAHRAEWAGRGESGRSMAAGLYFVRLVVADAQGRQIETRRFARIR